MYTEITNKPLALRGMQRVDLTEMKVKPVQSWSWNPVVKDPEKLDKMLASGSNTTSKNTFRTQMDHGENR